MNSSKTSIEQLLADTQIDAKLSVKTHFLYTVINVSENGKFVDLIENTLRWTECTDGDVFMTDPYGNDILCSPKKPEIIFDIPVKQYKEGDFHIRKRPKVGDVGYIEVFYDDISTWKDNGGFQAPQSINIMDKNSCVFVNGLIAHNEDSDSLPPQNILQIKGRTTEFEMQDAVIPDQVQGIEGQEAKITAKIGDNFKIELSNVSDSTLQNPSVAKITLGTTILTLSVPLEGDASVTLENGGNVSVSCKTATITTTDGVSITGNTSITGDVNVSGTVTATTDCVGGGISLKGHTHPVPGTGLKDSLNGAVTGSATSETPT